MMMMLKFPVTKKLLEKVQWEVKVERHEEIHKTVEYPKCHQDQAQHQVNEVGVNLVLQDPDPPVVPAVVLVPAQAAQWSLTTWLYIVPMVPMVIDR